MRSSKFTMMATNYVFITMIQKAELSARRFALLISNSPTKAKRTDLSLVNSYGRVTVSKLSLLRESLMLQRIANTCPDGMLYHYQREQPERRKLFKKIMNGFKVMTQSFSGLIAMNLDRKLLKQPQVFYHLARYASPV